MGNGASAGIAAAASTASVDELKAALAGLPAEARKKLQDGLSANADQLNILLQEDLLIRGGAQLWLMNCGSRLREAGHQVTFLLPDKSLIVDDCKAIPGAKVATYDADAIAESPETFTEQFTELLKPADVCVTLVRQKRIVGEVRTTKAQSWRRPPVFVRSHSAPIASRFIYTRVLRSAQVAASRTSVTWAS
eukprot:2277469-Prymnesium_polylepis.1